MFQRVQMVCEQGHKLTDMKHCAFCTQPATMTIVSSPERVCFTHAMEFWDGLMAYAKERTPSDSGARTFPPSPGDHVGFAMRLAS